MLYYKATAGCGVWGVRVSVRVRTAPCLSPWVVQRCGRAPQYPLAPVCYSSYTHWPHPASVRTLPHHTQYNTFVLSTDLGLRYLRYRYSPGSDT